jgi:hypothetical protein
MIQKELRCKFQRRKQHKMSEQEMQYSLSKILRTMTHQCTPVSVLKSKKLTISSVGEVVEQQELSFITHGKHQNGAATLENHLPISYKAKRSLTIQASNYTPRYLSN